MIKLRYVQGVFALILAMLLAGGVGAFSIRELLGLGDDTTGTQEQQKARQKPAEARAGGQNWAQPAGAERAVTLAHVERVLANLDAGHRQTLLADQAAFLKFVQQEADNMSVISAAEANKLHQDANTVFLMQRGAEQILRESYLTRLIGAKLPADFPSDAQIREYFDKNKGKFVIPDRVHVWQIFLAVNADSGEQQVAARSKQAKQILQDLKAGKTDFAAAAATYSEHTASRGNGGYMGMVKVTDLKPEIREPLLKLKEGQLSQVVKTDAGLHVLKRGAMVPGRDVEFAEVETQIRQLLLKQARAQLRQAIYEQARKTYPMEIRDSKVEEWRLRLKTNLQPSSAATGKPASNK